MNAERLMQVLLAPQSTGVPVHIAQRAGRTDREGDGVGPHRVDVPLLPGGLGSHGAPTAHDLGRHDLGGPLVVLEHPHRAPHALAVEFVTLLEQHHVVSKSCDLVHGMSDVDHGHLQGVMESLEPW